MAKAKDTVLTKEEFVHFRAFRPNGRVLARGGATVYYCPQGVHAPAIGVSICSFKDNFSRKIGNAISRGRAQTDVTPELDREELMKVAMEAVQDASRRVDARHGIPSGATLAIVGGPKGKVMDPKKIKLVKKVKKNAKKAVKKKK